MALPTLVFRQRLTANPHCAMLLAGVACSCWPGHALIRHFFYFSCVSVQSVIHMHQNTCRDPSLASKALGNTCTGRYAASKCARLSARYRKVSYIYCGMPLFMQPGSVPTAGLQKLLIDHSKRRATGRDYAKGVPEGFTCGRIFPHTACHGVWLCQIIV